MEIARTFAVRILYREPTYEAARGLDAREFSGTFRVSALSEEDARAIALLQFRWAERNSSVGWVREVQRIEVRASAAGT